MNEQAWLFLVGTLIAVISYFSKNFIFQPLLEFKEVKGRVQNRLKYNANKIHDAKTEVLEEVGKEFRQLSCDLEEKYYAISLKGFLQFIKIIPTLNDLSEAASNLIGLSNTVGTKEYENSHKNIQTIKSKLKII